MLRDRPSALGWFGGGAATRSPTRVEPEGAGALSSWRTPSSPGADRAPPVPVQISPRILLEGPAQGACKAALGRLPPSLVPSFGQAEPGGLSDFVESECLPRDAESRDLEQACSGPR